MKGTSIAVFILLSSIFCLSTPAEFECDFRYGIFWVVGQKYSCEVKNNPEITSPATAVVTHVFGTHKENMSIDDVTFFRADRKEIEYFPQGLESFFPNLEGIILGVNKLKEIRSSDLKPFPNLTYLNLGENQIQVLEDGVFDYNPYLEVLVFWGDRIIHIGMNVFNNLKMLTSLSLGNNVCIVLIAEQNSTAVNNVINKARIQCKNYVFQMLNDKIRNLELDAQKLNSKNLPIFEQNLYNLECEIKHSKFSFITSFKERIQRLKDHKINDKEQNNLNQEIQPRIGSDILNQIDLKIKELEKRLMDKIEAVLNENIGQILKAVKDENQI